MDSPKTNARNPDMIASKEFKDEAFEAITGGVITTSLSVRDAALNLPNAIFDAVANVKMDAEFKAGVKI